MASQDDFDDIDWDQLDNAVQQHAAQKSHQQQHTQPPTGFQQQHAAAMRPPPWQPAQLAPHNQWMQQQPTGRPAHAPAVAPGTCQQQQQQQQNEQLQRQSGGLQPQAGNTELPWSMFCSQAPAQGSSCMGWASKRLQPRHRQQQQQQRWQGNSQCSSLNAPQQNQQAQQQWQQLQHHPQQGQQPHLQQPQGLQQLSHSSMAPLPLQQQQQTHVQLLHSQPQQHQQQQLQHQQQQQQHQPCPSYGQGQQQGQWGQQPPHAPPPQQPPHALPPQQQQQHHQGLSNQQPSMQQDSQAWQAPGSTGVCNGYGVGVQSPPGQQLLDGQQRSGCNAQQPAAGSGVSVAAGAASGGMCASAAAAAAPPGAMCAPAAASGRASALAAAASGGMCQPAASGGAAAASGGPPVACGPILCSAKLSLGPKGLVEASFTSWHEELVAACLSIPGARRADSHSAAWCKRFLLPADKVAQLEGLLKDLKGIRVTKIEPLPDLVLKVLAAHRRQPDDSSLYEALGQLQLAPGESLEQRMMPFQRQGVQFGLRVGGRLLIGDEMGLGKTVQACALAKCYQAEWPVLVVTPSSLRLSWAAALYDWLRVTDDRVLVVLKRNDMQRLADAPSQAAARSMYDFVVLSYDLLKDVASLLEGLAFQVVILDESHCIKNPKAGRTQNTLPLLKKAKRAILLSGTPALNRPTELMTQLQGLLPKAAITKTAFEGRYAKIVDCGRFKKNDGSQNEEELNRLLTSTIMIRRRKAEVLKDLPAKLRKQVWLMLSDSERKQLTKLKQDLQEVRQMTTDMYGLGQAVGGSLLQGMQQEQRNKVMALYHQTAAVKASAVAAYVADLVVEMSDRQDKFLVFAYHKELMDAIQSGVCGVIRKNKEFKDLKFMRIDGSTPAKQREANVNHFQQDDNCRVAILNIKAAGVGLTLTRASTVVFAELAWTPSEVQQAEDRAHRIGQTSCVSVQLLLVKDSIDEVMWEMLQNKLASTGQVLDGQAERMEVDKSSAAHRSKGALGWQEEADTQQDNQKSIKSFFGPTEGKEAAKKQRLN